MPKSEHHWDFLDTTVIARLSRLTVSVRLPMLGSVTGIHRSATRGSSVEFAEYRKYAPGDDLKFLDWRVFARTDKYFIREFEADTNLRCYVVLDTSASMKFTSGQVTRFDFARRIAGTLAHPKPQGETNHVTTLHDLAERIRQRSLVIIISDLFTEVPELLECFKHLRFYKHDVAVFHLLDRQEFDFNFTRPVRFVDMESGADLITDPAVVRDAYREALQSYMAALVHGCREFNVDYHLLYLDQSCEAVLTQFLLQR